VSSDKAGDNDDGDNSSDDAPSHRYDKSAPYELYTDENGWPIIPEEETLPLTTLRDLIRSIVTVTYREW
jgi:hypothetical protein